MGRSYKYEQLKERKVKTKVVTNEEYKGKKQFKIYETKADGTVAVIFDRNTGEKKNKKPVFNFGIVKAKLLLHYLSELEAYVKDQESN